MAGLSGKCGAIGLWDPRLDLATRYLRRSDAKRVLWHAQFETDCLDRTGQCRENHPVTGQCECRRRRGAGLKV